MPPSFDGCPQGPGHLSTLLRSWTSFKLQGNPPGFRGPLKTQGPSLRFGVFLCSTGNPSPSRTLGLGDADSQDLPCGDGVLQVHREGLRGDPAEDGNGQGGHNGLQAKALSLYSAAVGTKGPNWYPAPEPVTRTWDTLVSFGIWDAVGSQGPWDTLVSFGIWDAVGSLGTWDTLVSLGYGMLWGHWGHGTPWCLWDMGCCGVTGDMGHPGVLWDRRCCGVTGDMGHPGVLWDRRCCGVTGDMGHPGVLWDMGYCGVTGDMGHPGVLWDMGCCGVTGDMGHPGVLWDRRCCGVTGDMGHPGVLWDMGCCGVTGDMGHPGVLWDMGCCGVTGDMGHPGVLWDRRCCGVTGDMGHPGVLWDMGCCGVMRAMGLPGVLWDMGCCGVTGDMGHSGVLWDMGCCGVTGDIGHSGVLWDTGHWCSLGHGILWYLLGHCDALQGHRTPVGDSSPLGTEGTHVRSPSPAPTPVSPPLDIRWHIPKLMEQNTDPLGVTSPSFKCHLPISKASPPGCPIPTCPLPPRCGVVIFTLVTKLRPASAKTPTLSLPLPGVQPMSLFSTVSQTCGHHGTTMTTRTSPSWGEQWGWGPGHPPWTG
uniref:Uncharacterized protein n=1 Tax=Strigops habroptila TaxID=2489341 RepID=A0A672U0Q8_STRHB